jgi:uncharacterized protein DUF3105
VERFGGHFDWKTSPRASGAGQPDFSHNALVPRRLAFAVPLASGLLLSCTASQRTPVQGLHPDAGCLVTIDSPPLLPAIHVALDADIQWDSNPPSSGPHYGVWAAYGVYTSPVPRIYYVHNLEHGAIVFLYNCGDAGCPDIVAALQAASDAIPDDPLCTTAGEGVRVRTIITPDPLLDVPVAAAAWGWTYKAQCADLPTLEQFALDHYRRGPEDLCGNGQMF